jgi:hypothetical protein
MDFRLRNCVQKDLEFFSNLEAIVLTCYGLLFTKLYKYNVIKNITNQSRRCTLSDMS